MFQLLRLLSNLSSHPQVINNLSGLILLFNREWGSSSSICNPVVHLSTSRSQAFQPTLPLFSYWHTSCRPHSTFSNTAAAVHTLYFLALHSDFKPSSTTLLEFRGLIITVSYPYTVTVDRSTVKLKKGLQSSCLIHYHYSSALPHFHANYL